MFEKVRAFFKKRHVLEVDCHALMSTPPIDSNVEVIEAHVADGQIAYLHTSPEYAMKKLLSSGSGDIFYLGHVYRKGEMGPRHNPEFTMIEWYRVGMGFKELIQETCELIQLFIGSYPIRYLSYREAFQKYAGIDPFGETDFGTKWDKETWLHYYMSHSIEPNLGKNELTVLWDYPPSQAALARVVEKDSIQVAERFEIYLDGVELCNGYHELNDEKELRRRFEMENQARMQQKKEPYALDEKFLSAIERLPDACGVSVGFDRLMMLRHKAKNLKDILSFAWE
jgi:elongation factor P--(R)-beta-lysine ligase